MGYLSYEIGLMKYTSNPQSIIIEWAGLKSKAEAKTKIKSINYTLIVSNLS